MDGKPIEYKSKSLTFIESVEMFIVMKCKYFGKGLCITPFAKLNNGYLDVFILKRTTRIKLIRLFLQLQSMKHDLSALQDPLITYFRCKSITIEPINDEGKIIKNSKLYNYPDVGIDGEIGYYLPLTIKVKQQSLPMFNYQYKSMFK